ncbi:MAG TPA: efflux RND transporter periplasmic adaptor subunit [Gemmatimonadaceae bacterium]|nr:efflux RND transporter periplasmic adaptor subunit [Gemmatimonadaceae bacterium]
MRSIVKYFRSAPRPTAATPDGSPHAGRTRPPSDAWHRVRQGAGVLFVVAALVVALRSTVMRPPVVTVATVTRGDVVAEIEGTGTVTADVLADVSSKITGRVEQVFVNEGDRVRRGQVIAALDQADLRWQVQAARATLAGAREAAEERQREWAREQTLVASGAVSTEDWQQYRERNAVAQSALHAAEADLGSAAYRLTLTRIPSLVSGVVTQRWVVPGASVVPGQPLFTVADTSVIYVSAYIDQDFTGKIRKGESASVLLRGRERAPLSGYVLRMRPRADAATEETVAEVAVSLPLEEFQLGQWANVYLQVGKATNALVIPRAALMAMGDRVLVFALDGRNTVHQVPVTVIASSPRASGVAVTGNLRTGERVVLMPMGLRDGQTVRAARADTGHAAMTVR